MKHLVMCLTLLVPGCLAPAIVPQSPPASASESCFLLFELSVGELRRAPAEACRTRITPASTFKVPHALAALDAGVVSGPGDKITYDGTGQWPESARRDHTMATAMQNSVVWYFQRIAERLGSEREQAYLKRLAYGNMDSSSGLTTFWLGESLTITPEEQQSAAKAVREMLIEPPGVVVNAAGRHPFNAPWPAGRIVSGKTGSATDASGRGVRWLIGHVKKGSGSYVFVSCVIGPQELGANAAIDLAARSLRDAQVL